jgi:virginiamycin B lyase
MRKHHTGIAGICLAAALGLGFHKAAAEPQQQSSPTPTAAVPAHNHHKLPPKPGVKTPGVQIPLAKLTPEAIYSIPGSPDWIVVDEDVWISNKPKNSVSRLDPHSNKVLATYTTFSKPCSGLAIGAKSLWVPNCGDGTLARVDLKTGQVSKTIKTGVADSEGGIAYESGSVWLVTDPHSTLSRINAETNEVSAKIQLPEGCASVASGFGAVWVSCPKQNTIIRVNPKSNQVESTITVGAQPRFLSAGEGAVWALTQGDGKVWRINPKTNKVEAEIEVGIPGPGGDISAGEGSVWATSFGFPVSRIDPKTNKVVQQFAGNGGDAIRAGGGKIWLSNYQGSTEWRLDPKKVMAITGE